MLALSGSHDNNRRRNGAWAEPQQMNELINQWKPPTVTHHGPASLSLCLSVFSTCSHRGGRPTTIAMATRPWQTDRLPKCSHSHSEANRQTLSLSVCRSVCPSLSVSLSLPLVSFLYVSPFLDVRWSIRFKKKEQETFGHGERVTTTTTTPLYLEVGLDA